MYTVVPIGQLTLNWIKKKKNIFKELLSNDASVLKLKLSVNELIWKSPVSFNELYRFYINLTFDLIYFYFHLRSV